ncbi:hypothetical protein HP550_09470 [Cellulomonas humilata]|uniref:Integral membrane protein n=1 Tax=Cellulomonas humilata TaxID=144055 RepID=A0A7Y6A2V5_9CELL|nr:hypothetical protein [Cellulomonas humilata]NUU17479.1 hypothetical protein [Cellulomonas humilata]
MLELTDAARITAGAVVLSVVAIESGGAFLLRVATGKEQATAFQKTFYRAGHAHAGVLVTLGLVCLLLGEATTLTGFWRWLAQTGVLVAAIVMSAGFFFSAMGRGREAPNKAVVLLGVGAVLLAAGVATLGVGLLLG